MRFSELLKAIGKGIVIQLPVMGPVLASILAEQDRTRLEDRLAELIKQFSVNRSEPVGSERVLISALHLAQAELTRGLETVAGPQRRFLYLAGRHYAGPERTLEIAEQYGFLWRSYHKESGEANANVKYVKAGDIIVLGYRVEDNKFRLLLPLVLTDGNENTRPIATAVGPDRPDGRTYTPFIWADGRLSEILKLDYGVDPLFGEFTGLAVKPLFTTDVTADVLQGTYDSPGRNALWRHDFQSKTAEVSPPVRDWIARLGARPSDTM